METPRIVITPGEPAGIGPDLVVMLAQRPWPAHWLVVADPDLLMQRAELLGLPLSIQLVSPLEAFKKKRLPNLPHQPGTIHVIPVKLATPSHPGQLERANAEYVLTTLQLAADLCLQKAANAIVTGPVHKENMNSAGIVFSGHTEFFAQYCGVKQTVMLFVVNNMKVALLTTHIPLANVPMHITRERMHNIVSILQTGLKQHFHLAHPRIAVCGLNPHAGEGGYLGREEIDVLEPCIKELNAEGYLLSGPHPADTIFTPDKLADADVILAMYHDQALPVVKYAGFDHAVNVTLGLPFLRTSVDHGTALTLAGTGNIQSSSMEAALNLAISLV